MKLLPSYSGHLLEAGCDEAGRGCIAGPVFAAAVVLPAGFSHEGLQDSKRLTARQRNELRLMIQEEALAWGVSMVDNETIDKINILNASFLAMHMALEDLKVTPALILVDGNRFRPFHNIKHICIVKGDGKYQSIAAASILAKTWRDEYMEGLHGSFPDYGWNQNKGYPTLNHRKAVFLKGLSPYHRRSFRISCQTRLEL